MEDKTKYFIKEDAIIDDPDFQDEVVYYCEWCKNEEFLGTLGIGKKCEDCEREIIEIESESPEYNISKNSMLKKLDELHPAQKAVLKMAKEIIKIAAAEFDDVDSMIDVWWEELDMDAEEMKNSETIKFVCEQIKIDI